VRRVALAAAMLAWATGLLPGAESLSTADIPRVMQQLRAALADGRPADAEALARAVIRDQPGYAEAYGELARALEAQGRRAAAVSVLLDVGQGLAQAGLATESQPYLRRAVELAPESAATHAALGHALLLTREYLQSAQQLQRAMELGERGLAVRIYLGSAQWEMGEADAAEATLREAVTSSRRAPPAVQTLAGFLVWRGAFTEAIELLGEALRHDPDSLQLQLDLARALDGAGQADAAIAAYRRVAERAADLTEPHYALTRLLRERGDVEGAKQAMERFMELHAAEQERTHRTMMERARLDAGWELIRQGQTAEAITHFGGLTPSVASLTGLAAAHSAAGDHTAAARALERALALAPERADLKINLARERLEADR